MADVSEALTRKIADLARLELSDSEVKTFTTQLGDVLKYVEMLNAVDVTGVEPMTHPFNEPTPLREDVVRASPRDAAGKPKTLSPAPEVIDDGFKVPQII